MRCEHCGFGSLEPLPSENDLLEIYQEDYHNYLDDSDYLADAQKKYEFVKNYLVPQDRILDIGCGLGHFLAIAKADGVEVQGYDISVEAAKLCQTRFNISVNSNHFNTNLFQSSSFDLITGFDVIEHIVNFKDSLAAYHQWLKQNGLLMITTPDLDSWDAKILGTKWYGFTRIPQHINYFDRRSIQMILEESGFEIIESRLWGFVRSYGYLADSIRKQSFFAKLIRQSGLQKKQVYLPMTDMMIVARKKNT